MLFFFNSWHDYSSIPLLYLTIFSAVVFEDRSVATGVDEFLTCTITGLSKSTPVTWIDPDNNEISTTDTDNYVIDQGTYDSGSKESILTIKQSKLETLSSPSIYKCQLKSARYPTHSPVVVKEMTLTIIGLSTFVNHFVHTLWSVQDNGWVLTALYFNELPKLFL